MLCILCGFFRFDLYVYLFDIFFFFLFIGLSVLVRVFWFFCNLVKRCLYVIFKDLCMEIEVILVVLIIIRK